MQVAPTVAIETHGCKLNQADSSKLAWEFASAGFRVVGSDMVADVYIINSCTVTHVADKKARQALRAAKKHNPGAIIVATGCYAQRAPESLAAIAEVDIVAGNTAKPDLVRMVTDSLITLPSPVSMLPDTSVFSVGAARTRAMVKIQEGCDQVCAYCIVPRVRGRERSIAPETIIAEIDTYLSRGYKEIVLPGTQLGGYGFDLDRIDLSDLLRRILEETGAERLRVSSVQPQEFTPDLLQVWKDARVCPHFHMPLQSGSDKILSRMRRRYSAAEYETAVELVRSAVPHASITTDIIVGFPGESAEDFIDTLSVCQRVKFAGIHAFPYSKRPGTSAAYFDDQVAPSECSRRMNLLLKLAGEQENNFKEQSVGDLRPVLWEERKSPNGREFWSGLTDTYVRVRSDSNRDLANTITDAKITHVENGEVFVRVVPDSSAIASPF